MISKVKSRSVSPVLDVDVGDFWSG
jgi:hypothetical protein